MDELKLSVWGRRQLQYRQPPMGPGDVCGGGGGRTEEAEGAAARRAILRTLTVASCLRLEQTDRGCTWGSRLGQNGQ